MSGKKKTRFWDGKFWQTLKKTAPDVAGELLGVAGDLTGVELLNKAGEMIAGDGGKNLTKEQRLELLELNKIEIQAQRLENEDRHSARTREIELSKTVGRDWFMYIVAGVVLGLLVFAVIYSLTRELANSELAHLLIGEITGMALGIVVYYYGSSRGSKDKNRVIEKALERDKI